MKRFAVEVVYLARRKTVVWQGPQHGLS